MPLNATCGLSPMATDKTRQVPETELKETSFVWIEPARDDFLKGSALDPLVSSIRIPGYIWPKAGDLGKSDDTALVGLFVHGGGYMMGNGSETFGDCGMRLYYYSCGMLSLSQMILFQISLVKLVRYFSIFFSSC